MSWMEFWIIFVAIFGSNIQLHAHIAEDLIAGIERNSIKLTHFQSNDVINTFFNYQITGQKLLECSSKFSIQYKTLI